MTVSTIASIAAGITRASGATNTKASAVLDSLVAGSSRTTVTDQTSVAATALTQTQSAQLRVASQQVAQASTVLSVAAQGASDITKGLEKLKDLAAKAQDPSLSDEERSTLDAEFQSTRASISTTAKTTSFNGEPLLTGQSAQLKVGTGDSTSGSDDSVGSFLDDKLFPASSPDPMDITTAADAADAFPAVFAALNYAAKETGKILSLQDGVDYASASLESASQNQEASRSTLADVDFEATTETQQLPQADQQNSLLAQTSKLPTNLLQLLSE